jgi:hypothetical protein
VVCKKWGAAVEVRVIVRLSVAVLGTTAHRGMQGALETA